jgi:hypothetical protein
MRDNPADERPAADQLRSGLVDDHDSAVFLEDAGEIPLGDAASIGLGFLLACKTRVG